MYVSILPGYCTTLHYTNPLFIILVLCMFRRWMQNQEHQQLVIRLELNGSLCCHSNVQFITCWWTMCVFVLCDILGDHFLLLKETFASAALVNSSTSIISPAAGVQFVLFLFVFLNIFEFGLDICIWYLLSTQ